MNEKEELIISAIEDTLDGLEAMNRQFMGLEAFIRDNFRHYNSYGATPYPYFNTAKQTLKRLELLTSTNKDNAHRLSTEEPVEQPRQQNQQQQNGYQYQPQRPTPFEPPRF